ncbi:T9SS type A sorting domain-containing protein [uncultured Pontibacter sp.]|uniref:T9SS type A sorting domain-containing protein n=1 Tax=uncultured Pontibacter sp. TaxID=453356 RepID=UPI002608D853|nr:T9SS type A sorting domain-containing protein [uncultured Pontibacter sp.]
MDYITTLQNFIRFILSLLLALLPLYTIVAQEAPKAEKKLHIKYIETKDGVETVKDTTITITEMTMTLPSFSGLKADTAALRKLSNRTFKFADTTRLKAATGKNVKVYKLNGKLTEAEHAAYISHLKTSQNDSLLNVLLKNGKIAALQGDSLRAVMYKRLGKADGIHTYTFDKINPKGVLRVHTDTLKSVWFSHRDSIKHVGPVHAERIYIRKRDKNLTVDSLVLKANGKVMYKLITNDSTASAPVFGLGEAGEAHSFQQFTLEPGKVIAIVVTKATVQDLTAEDVAALKKTGASVETKPKEELKLENVEYYPNPNDGRFNLRFEPENKGTTVVSVIDSKGEEVFVDTVENLNTAYSRQIDLTPFGKGLYFLQIAQGKRYFTKKILVR